MSFDFWHPMLASHRLLGEEIRRRLGRRYYVLPSERVFHCHFHRQVAETNGGAEQEKRQPCCEGGGRLAWPSDARSSDLKREHLPHVPLPDNRWVWFLPMTDRLGSILPHVWGPLLDAAQAARGPILAHSYEVTLARLQAWKKSGASIKDYEKKRDAMRVSGTVGSQTIADFERENDPTGDNHRLFDWMAFWDHEIFLKPEELAKPFEAAFEMLSKVTGYAPSAIKSIVRRDKEFGAVTQKPRGPRQAKSG